MLRDCAFHGCMDDLTNSQQFKRRSTTDDANPPKRRFSGEIGSLSQQENNPYLSVYRRVESSSSVASSIVPSSASVVPSSSFVLPANLPILESPHLLSIPSTVPVHFECDEVDDDFMDLPIRHSHNARLDAVLVPIQPVSLH